MKVAATTLVPLAALERAIIQRIGEPRYQLWLASRTHFRLTGDQLTVGVPNLYAQEYLQKKFQAALQAAAKDVTGRTAEVRFTIDPKLFQQARADQEAVKQAGNVSAACGLAGAEPAPTTPAPAPVPRPRN